MIVQREEKKDNRGFSLVELIIVIAIMAILVAVLAPQFLKYVERSRHAADVDNAKEITNAISAYVADTETTGTLAASSTVTVTHKGITVTDANVVKAMQNAGLLTASAAKDTLIDTITCRSNQEWASYCITVNVDKNNVTFTYEAGTNPDAYTKDDDATSVFQKNFQGGKTTT